MYSQDSILLIFFISEMLTHGTHGEGSVFSDFFRVRGGSESPSMICISLEKYPFFIRRHFLRMTGNKLYIPYID